MIPAILTAGLMQAGRLKFSCMMGNNYYPAVESGN
jgi:hypothetical protein